MSRQAAELRALNETDLEDRAARLAILNDPDYIRAFKRMWMSGKQGWGLARLKRKLKLEDYAFNRTLADMTVERCPIENWQGKDLQTVYERVLAILQQRRQCFWNTSNCCNTVSIGATPAILLECRQHCCIVSNIAAMLAILLQCCQDSCNAGNIAAILAIASNIAAS